MNTSTTETPISRRLERLPISWLHIRLLFIHGFGWFFDAMDVGIVTFVMVALAKDWHLKPDQLGLIGSSGLAGMFIGALVSGVVADYFGRKRVFQVTLLIFASSSLLCAFAWDLTSLIVFRFLVGIGLGGELPVVASLLSEFIPGERRGRFIVLLESFWAFGWLAAAIVAYVVIPVHGWRIAFVIGALPAFYIWVVRRKLPESPRWYESRGKFREAEAIMESLERDSERITKKPLPPTPSLETAPAISMNNGFSFLRLWTPEYLQITLMLWILWFGLVFGYYGIFVWLPSLLVKAGYTMVNSFLYVIVITVAQIPGYFSAAYCVEKYGRKPTIAIFLIASAIAAFAFGKSISTGSILTSACIMSFFNLGAWGAVYTYTPELYPTFARATGAGSAAAFGRIGGFLAPIVVGHLLPSIGRSGIMTLNAAMLAIAAVSVSLFGGETKGIVLEDASRGRVRL